MKVHMLKCHAENFDAITSGAKRCEVRHEEDRTFSVGDRLRLVRTDVDGVPTTPGRWCEVEVLHLTRHAGGLVLMGVDLENERKPLSVAVMSIAPVRS